MKFIILLWKMFEYFWKLCILMHYVYKRNMVLHFYWLHYSIFTDNLYYTKPTFLSSWNTFRRVSLFFIVYILCQLSMSEYSERRRVQSQMKPSISRRHEALCVWVCHRRMCLIVIVASPGKPRLVPPPLTSSPHSWKTKIMVLLHVIVPDSSVSVWIMEV